jgi:hypothetical protein
MKFTRFSNEEMFKSFSLKVAACIQLFVIVTTAGAKLIMFISLKIAPGNGKYCS